MKAASHSYFISVKRKCLLAWKEGFDLRQNKKNHNFQVHKMTYVHQFSIKAEISEYHGLFSWELRAA